MEIKIAGGIGFCFGVKRAVGLAEAELEKGRPIYSIGPIIHNPQVVKRLSERGLKVAQGLDGAKEGFFLIPSHGAGPALVEEARERGLDFVDTTCPFVMKSQELVKSLSREGYKILIVGEAFHPEVQSLVDCAGGAAEVIASREEVEKLDLRDEKIGVIAQTTQSEKNYLEIVSLVLGKQYKELRILRTVCRETVRRQEAARNLAGEVDIMLVIGGRNSANTSRLARICRELGTDVRHIEDAGELKLEWFRDKRSVGISSGASTPDWIVKEVLSKLKSICHLEKEVVI